MEALLAGAERTEPRHHRRLVPSREERGLDQVEEGSLWKAEEFSSLHIRDATLKNAKNHSSEWHLMATRDGTPMHQEAFTKNALWVTRYRWSEMAGNDLPTYVNGETVSNSDVVLGTTAACITTSATRTRT